MQNIKFNEMFIKKYKNYFMVIVKGQKYWGVWATYRHYEQAKVSYDSFKDMKSLNFNYDFWIIENYSKDFKDNIALAYLKRYD